MPQRLRRGLDRRRDPRGRRGLEHKEVVLHTHFNHPVLPVPPKARSICSSNAASPCATRRGLQRGVNDTIENDAQPWSNAWGTSTRTVLRSYAHDLVKKASKTC